MSNICIKLDRIFLTSRSNSSTRTLSLWFRVSRSVASSSTWISFNFLFNLDRLDASLFLSLNSRYFETSESAFVLSEEILNALLGGLPLRTLGGTRSAMLESLLSSQIRWNCFGFLPLLLLTRVLGTTLLFLFFPGGS